MSKITAVGAFVALVLAGCRGASQSEKRAAVTIKGIQFSPSRLLVGAKTTVVWTNDDPVAHTVTSGEQGTQGIPGVSESTPGRPNGLFDEELNARGSSFDFTFGKLGSYPYFCRIHQSMKGVIVVQ